MGKFLSTKGWKTLLSDKDCKALKEPELEKLIVLFEAAERSADARAVETHFAKIQLKFRDLKKANAKNKTLIKWMDQASAETEQFIASLAQAPQAENVAAARPTEKPAEVKPAAAKPAEKPPVTMKEAPERTPKAEKPAEAKSAAPKEKAEAKKDAEAAKAAPSSKEDEQRGKLSEMLATELTLARRRSKDKASKFVLNVDAKSPGLMLTRKEMTPNLLKAAVFLSGKRGKLLEGLCYGESGKWVFAFDFEPSDVLIRLLKKAALDHAATKLKLKVVGGGKELDDGEPGDPEEAVEADAPAAAPAAEEERKPGDADLQRAATRGRMIWNKTKENVDTLIGRLVMNLRQNADPELNEIAEAMEAMAAKGLPGIAANAQTTLIAGLMDLEKGAPETKAARDKVLGAVASYRDGLADNTFVDLCEQNPFKVQVPIRPLVGRALDEIEKTISAS